MKYLSRLFFALFFSLIAVSGHAADDRLTVRGVAVDVAAENSAAARDKALVAGQRQAFEQLWNAQAPEKPVPKLSDEQIGDLVRDFTVQSEKTSGTRYVATLTYRFRSAATERLLSKSGISLVAPTPAVSSDDAASSVPLKNSETAPDTSTHVLVAPVQAAATLSAVFLRVPVDDLASLQRIQNRLINAGGSADLVSLTRRQAVWRLASGASLANNGIVLQPSQQPVWWQGQWQPVYQASLR